jgi:hypothetical protein
MIIQVTNICLGLTDFSFGLLVLLTSLLLFTAQFVESVSLVLFCRLPVVIKDGTGQFWFFSLALQPVDGVLHFSPGESGSK